MTKIQIEDIAKYRFLSDVQYAPGGGAAAFVVSNADMEENDYERYIWLYENGEIRQLTGLGKESGFAWLDDHRLIFPAVRSTSAEARQGRFTRRLFPRRRSGRWTGRILPLWALSTHPVLTCTS